MNAIQLEFAFEECLSTAEQVAYMRKELDAAKECWDRSRRKLFKQLNEIQQENKDLKSILRDLVSLLDKSQSENCLTSRS